MKDFDIFISYNWDVKPSVKMLYNQLHQKHNFKVWMDEYEIGQNRLVDELSNAIKNSKIFLCCITKKYSESENCKDEIAFAKSLQKPMIILMFERLNMEDLGGVGFIIGPKVRFNCYKNPELLNKWSDDEVFKSILHAINENLETSHDSTSVNNQNKNTLYSTETLQSENMLVSKNNKYFAIVQTDGNFCVYKSDSFKRDNCLWSSQTFSSRNPKPFTLKLFESGDLLLNDQLNSIVWKAPIKTNQIIKTGHKLVMQDDGNLVLYDGQMNPFWATDTWSN